MLLIWLGGVSTYAQAVVDTSLTMPAIEITASNIRNESMGFSGRSWDAEEMLKLNAQNVAELLSSESGSYLKSYGLGSIATSSVRGGNAGHTLLLWNGLPLNSPMLAQLDLSLLPIFAAESVRFTPGSNTALWGSGAIGGIIDLQNTADFSKKVVVQNKSGIGSFGRFLQQNKILIGNQKFQSITRLSLERAENDFFYNVGRGIPDKQQTNASFKQHFIMQELYWKINAKHSFSLQYWGQNSNRNIPPTIVQSKSEAQQNDVVHRLFFDLKGTLKNGVWNVKGGYFNERLDYRDQQILLKAESHFSTFIGEMSSTWSPLKGHLFLAGMTYTKSMAQADGYKNQVPEEDRTALFVSWKYGSKKYNSQFSVRQEFLDNTILPFIPSLTLEYYFQPEFKIRGKFNRNYRLPSLNDRFWIPGGNPDILPESGWSQETGIDYTLKNKKFVFLSSLTAYHRIINNWILWSQQPGEFHFSANNITSVRSYGLEPRVDLSYTFQKSIVGFKVGYDFVRAINLFDLVSPYMTAGSQLIYTPVHQISATFSMSFLKFSFMYHHQLTGKTKGINEDVDTFLVGNFRLFYQIKNKNGKAGFFMNCNNIWDADYVVVERRPMPGIHFMTGVQISFEK